MPIERNAGGGSLKFITEPGEYAVEVNGVSMGKSKKNDPMVTIEFMTADKRLISAYFVQKYPFMMEALAKLKIACGEKPDVSSDKLLGKKCGILVEKGKVNDKGQAFAQITGYGPSTEVDPTKSPSGFQETHATDEIPF